MKSTEFYKSTAWKHFSRYVLLYYSIEGLVKCETSKRWYACNDRLMHCGHLIKVFEGGGNTNFNTAFDFRNVLPQCHQDNVHKGGNELKMLDAIERIHGKGTYDELKIKSKLPFKLDKYTLDLIVNEYKVKFNELVKIKGNPWK